MGKIRPTTFCGGNLAEDLQRGYEVELWGISEYNGSK